MTTNIDEFFDGLPDQDKKIEGELDLGSGTPATPVEGENEGGGVAPEKDDEPRKNRRHRRLEQQLQEEREARIAAEARAEAISESSRFASEVNSGDVDERWLRIYGDTPEARQAWALQSDILNDYKTQAKDEALREVQEQQIESTRQQREYESFIDSELEGIEDEYNIDVTSDAPQARKARREFLEMVQQASPKDENGEITDYADFGYVWEMYELKKGNKNVDSNTAQKDISSRTMSRSGGSGTGNAPTITPGFDGWRKDYGIK